MNIMDIVALAKQGFTPSDVRELIALSDKTDDPVIEQVEEAEQKTVQEDVQKEEAEPVTDDNAIDYKKLYEEEKAKNEQLSGDLQTAQSNNVAKDMSDKTDKSTDTDLINELVKSFM